MVLLFFMRPLFYSLKLQSGKYVILIKNTKKELKKKLLIKVLHSEGIAKRDDISIKNCKMNCL